MCVCIYIMFILNYKQSTFNQQKFILHPFSLAGPAHFGQTL